MDAWRAKRTGVNYASEMSSLRMTPTMLHSIDHEGRIAEVSDLWLEKLGYTWDEVIGRPSTDFLSEDSARYAREVVLPLFFETGACDVEYDMVRKDGDLIPVRLRGVAVRSESGAFLRSIAVIEDLTELRALERKMFAAQKLESLGLMAGNIAHDFNNLLASVSGNAQLARRYTTHGTAATALDHIQIATTRAADLCRQLLAYSGRGHFQIESVELDDLVAEMSEVLSVNVAMYARISLALGAAGVHVEVDATQIRQILMNLVINAGEALAGRGGTIQIATAVRDLDAEAIAATSRPEALPGRYVELVVADDGLGMAPEILASIFDPFFTTKATGRGLGLAAVHGIVRGHHGTLHVTSEPGRGTRFHIFIPVPARIGAARGLAPVAPEGTSRPTIAVVDDDALLRSTLASQLADAGYDVVVAASASEALALATSSASIGAFLVDVTMPDTSGAELARMLQDRVPSARIVLMSGYSTVDLPAGPRLRFLRKPFSEHELRQAIELAS